MNRFLRTFVCAFAALTSPGTLQAATVELGMVVLYDGTWRVYAWAPGTDHDGISGFNIEIVNYIEGEVLAPVGYWQGPWWGFTVGGNPIPNAEAGDALFAGMNSTAPATLYYGVGSIKAGNEIPGPNLIPPVWYVQVPWWEDPDINTENYGSAVEGEHFIIPGYAFLVGEGTFDTTARDCHWTDWGSSTNANVWEAGSAANNGTNADFAQVNLNRVVVGIPEPASFAILGIAILGLLGLHRRWNR